MAAYARLPQIVKVLFNGGVKVETTHRSEERRSRWVSAENTPEYNEATRDKPYRDSPSPVTRIIREGDTTKADPFTILFLANPALETPWNSGTFEVDPVTSDQVAFDTCVSYACDSLFGSLPSQKENLLDHPTIGPKIRILSVFQVGLNAEDKNALVAQDSVSNLLVARRQIFIPFISNLGLQADVVYAISQSTSHNRASTWFTSDNDAGPGFNFTIDGVTQSHRFYNLIPGTVAMHTSARSLTPLHEFGHALSSYTNGALVDLYVDSEQAFNNKRGRPIPEFFATYSGTGIISDTSRGGLGYPAGWQSYHCELLNLYAPAVMDNYYLASGGSETCLHDSITKQFLLDRLFAKISR
ncbi:hypothetical protein VF14_21800 [Nostoc linckia z18]|uniref:Uncharacterized protein n=2 Tax=Nostoc linckia TaxID=92942 RepID=A0A9Q5ZA88_NOSLI|nr:hypothetical protein VF02_30985 [Nostoc linckia z1]PHJ59666.1 hypothetical protein VF05_31915 [Nostoc linckia z3]PHJ63966.1 hypothetical protein VF03_29765 [Nostoc linckia z2]PHJ75994.1 hypothetical protein VF06_32375 [Nostoc linckia z4]PHJ80485.1 hypothetical protein VF07_31835 [Nostoc linckia z6]PHJ93915.1 hypothetical protein VF04_24345 [Nostoc linckia z7]PHK01960.1 hypothetical protein VF08_20370 [Nostoc linckia z8]PHK08516.1 hypothetical protein VF09_19415 [Nostoc linckia z9]PHK1875